MMAAEDVTDAEVIDQVLDLDPDGDAYPKILDAGVRNLDRELETWYRTMMLPAIESARRHLKDTFGIESTLQIYDERDGYRLVLGVQDYLTEMVDDVMNSFAPYKQQCEHLLGRGRELKGLRARLYELAACLTRLEPHGEVVPARQSNLFLQEGSDYHFVSVDPLERNCTVKTLMGRVDVDTLRDIHPELRRHNAFTVTNPSETVPPEYVLDMAVRAIFESGHLERQRAVSEADETILM